MIMVNKGDGTYVEVIAIYAKDQDQYREISEGYTQDGELIFSPTYMINESYGYMPFQILADGDNVEDYTIWGNTVQDGTPTPDSPIEPEFVGEKTENLFGGQPGELFSVFIPAGTQVVLSCEKEANTGQIGLYQQDKTRYDYWSLSGFSTSEDRRYRAITITQDTYYISFPAKDVENYNPSVTLGTEFLPYEPYGYKIPISSAGQTKTIYLGQVQTTRRIKKLILTGEEKFIVPNINRFRVPIGVSVRAIRENMLLELNSHFIVDSSSESTLDEQNLFTSRLAGQGDEIWFFLPKSFFVNEINVENCKSEFSAYLAAQYAAGTPVTVWYVLRTMETSIVNEPLCRIGDYADSVTFEQAGIEISTLKKPNTTVIDIETEVKPSVINLTYWGEWQDKTAYLSSDNKLYITTDNQIYYTKR